jgi:hypothetical protein
MVVSNLALPETQRAAANTREEAAALPYGAASLGGRLPGHGHTAHLNIVLARTGNEALIAAATRCSAGE